MLDPAGYGAVTITKSITIDGGGTIASILSSGTNGVIINAPDGIVVLRHLNINGAGTGINGIRVIAAKKVIVEDCTLANFTQKGIEINTTDPCTVMLSNVIIHNAMDAVGTSNATLIIDNCRFQTISNAGVNVMSGQAIVSRSNISDCGTGVMAAAGGTINSTGNNMMVGNKVQGNFSSVIKLQ